jgi:hypothetical protein
VLPAGVTLAPQVSSLVIGNASAPSATSLAAIATASLLPSGNRPPSSITLHAFGDLLNRGVPNSDPYRIAVDPTYYSLDIAGTIATDPLGSVSLTGDQIAIVSGTVSAPGGTINLGGGTASYGASTVVPVKVPFTGAGVWVTDTGSLSTAGDEVTSVQSIHLAYEDVLPGGQVNGGYVVLAPRSVIDVSGAAGFSTLQAAGSGQADLIAALSHRRTFPVVSAGGTISISATLGAILEGTLLGKGGGANVAGGTLNLSLSGHGGALADSAYVPSGDWPAIENTYIVLEPTVAPFYLSDAQIGRPGTDFGLFGAPGTNLANLPRVDAYMPVSVQMVQNGGFASLILSAPPGLPTSDPLTNSGYGHVTVPATPRWRCPVS